MFKPGDLVKLTQDHAEYGYAEWGGIILNTNKKIVLYVKDIYASVLEVLPKTDKKSLHFVRDNVYLIHVVKLNAAFYCSDSRLKYYNENKIP